jgi:TorA maturation chaperone TorD
MTPRSDTYALLLSAYSFPGTLLLAQVQDGRWADRLAAALSDLPYRIGASSYKWTLPDNVEEAQTEFIRLFQIGGRRGPPCPLHAGHYARDRAQELRRLISFYNYFGFRVTECVMPDHITVQLEFMCELTQGNLADGESLLRAQRDFLERLAWSERLSARLRPASPAPFYRSLADLTQRLIAHERRYVNHALTGG